ncbi:MAG: hypothetical protein U9N55_02125 [candidate division Zixibacteria bacterium]|nr:hypothetical protein [candidate division Zixibacteria bacterium]
MIFNGSLRREIPTIAFVIVVSLVLLAIPSSYAQQPELSITVGDTTTAPGAQNTVISVYLDNYQDTVVAFNLWLKLSNPEIMEFKTDIDSVIDTTHWGCIEWDGEVCVDSIFVIPFDTSYWSCIEWEGEVCVDSTPVFPSSDWDFMHVDINEWDFRHIDTNEVNVGNYDTTGTLVSGWENVNAVSLGNGYDINIACFANMPPYDPYIPGVLPGVHGDIPLIKILADVEDIPDSATLRSVIIMPEYLSLSHFSFSRPNGTSIGITYDTILDTNYFLCTQWSGDSCMNWEHVSMPPADSVEIVEALRPRVDTETVFINNGLLTVSGAICGDADGSENVSIGDVNFLVDYCFLGGPAPDPLWVGDVDCSGGGPSIGDVNFLLSYLFLGGPEPCSGPECD